MTTDLAIVLALLLAAVAAFVVNRPRMDVVAILAIVLLPLSGVLTTAEALAGFSDPNVILIAALFVVGEGLVRTGVASRLGDWLVRRSGTSETKVIVLLMASVTFLGSTMSSTGVVAIFIPVVLRVARRMGTSPSRLMMPLSFAGLISGMMTLVATAPNLVVNGELARSGYKGFGFFSFTPFGLPVLVVGIAYMLVARRWLRGDEPADPARAAALARPSLLDFARRYQLEDRQFRMRILPDSMLAGRTVSQLGLRSAYQLSIVAVEKADRGDILNPTPGMILLGGDILLLEMFGTQRNRDEIERQLGLVAEPFASTYFLDHADEVGMAEVLVPPESRLIGQSVVSAALRSRYDTTVIGLRRGHKAFDAGLVDEKLKAGDVLLLVGPWKAIKSLDADRRDFVVLNLPTELDDVSPVASRAPYALLSLAVMVVLMISGIVPNVIAAFIACLLMGAFGCLTMPSAYRSIHWQSLVLIIGMLPFATALQKTGGVELAVTGYIDLLGGAGPYALLAGLFVITVVIGLFVSNTATAVLMAPVAISTAIQMDASPYPFAMIVALAASTAFITPVSSPVNTLVVQPGHYRFGDFVKIGFPFALIVMAISLLLVPWLLPLYP